MRLGLGAVSEMGVGTRITGRVSSSLGVRVRQGSTRRSHAQENGLIRKKSGPDRGKIGRPEEVDTRVRSPDLDPRLVSMLRICGGAAVPRTQGWKSDPLGRPPMSSSAGMGLAPMGTG